VRGRLVVVLAAVGMAAAIAPVAMAEDPGPFAECAPPTGAPVLTVGAVDCLRVTSAALGGVSVLSYYIPPACDPALGRRCPVLYYLHGTGGDHESGTGTAEDPSDWIAALTSGPASPDPRAEAEPWRFSDTSQWVPKPSIDMIIVSPHGRTLEGGHGPVADTDPFWFDWNPRYAAGGDAPRYDTPAPRFDDYVVDEIVPYVDRHFPTGADRAYRALVGYSMGGIGAFGIGLRHPDVFASIGMQSGGTFPFGAADGVAPASDAPVGVAPPAPVPHTAAPGAVPVLAPEVAWTQLYGPAATVGFGDFVADNVWWRQSQPAANVGNARARGADGRQALHLQYFVNDAVPRRTDDVTTLPVMGLFFEAVLSPTNRHLELLFERAGVERTFHIGPGHHWSPYQAVWLREQLEGQYTRVRHWDGGGDPPPPAAVFDYQSVDRSFAVWGWQVTVQRAATEFLYLRDVSCSSITVRGTGLVTAVVPDACGTGVDGSPVVTVDLGPSQATDEPATGVAASDAYGVTRTVALEPLLQ
jgi:S-formylglutathione hydrolase FrmB